MRSDRATDVTSALRLVRGGRFSEAVELLDRHPARHINRVNEALLADALQRTGQNDRAESIASRMLQANPRSADASGRCHFVLGNVYRERGTLAKAIEHFQMSTALAVPDFELACWAQLRLIAAVAELSGIEAAMCRMGELRSAMARLGDPRPFAALHLWLAEMETTRGHLDNARRHLSRAEGLLDNVEDVWLQGYLAINSSVVSYYCAEIDKARRWGQLALAFAQLSGHRGTRCAANANLGHIELSGGNLSKAGEYFQVALDWCEEHSVSQVAILDSIAQLKLQSGDLAGCRAMLSQLEDLKIRGDESKSRHYQLWARQTRIQLLLKEGKLKEARHELPSVTLPIDEAPQPRVSSVSYLLAAETLLASGEATEAANILCSLLSPPVQIPPDLFAQTERITAKAITGSGHHDGLARVHLDRAVRTFDAIGHRIGHSVALEELATLPTSRRNTFMAGMLRSLDRVRALIDTRSRAELFGHEAFLFLEELECTKSITLSLHDGNDVSTVLKRTGITDSSVAGNCVHLARQDRRTVKLSFCPREDPVSVITALEFRHVMEQIIAIGPPESELTDFDVVWAANDESSSNGVVFAAESMLAILNTVHKIAATNISVLITGETGVGKEIIAKRIHEQSGRADLAFVALNCAAIPRELLESQLFGYRRGAFSGASEPFQGVVRAANGGTLLLDEIGQLPTESQTKLLRFLETGEVHPIGEAYPIKVNVRMLFATNDNLEKAVQESRFREDLFHRINVISIRIPPLRERREEIPLLVNLFSKRFARECSKEPPRFSDSAMELLILHTWPGNVRQLGNEVRRITALMESDNYVTPDLLSPEIGSHRRESNRDKGLSEITINLNQTIEQATELLERTMLEHTLKSGPGRIADAAMALGLSRKGFYLKRKRLGLISGLSHARL
jgi:DNA-binding NtrC family response regulator/tetratricopeptide (TPR) repeat protein